MIGQSKAQWQRFLIDHMPPGEGLDLEPESLFARTFEALAIELSRFDALVDVFLAELDPRTTAELILEWERFLALPRDCQTPVTGVAERRALVLAIITRGRNLAPNMLIEAALTYGFTITIKEYFPFNNPPDLPTTNAFKYDVLGVTTQEFIIFRSGQSSSGEDLGHNIETSLSCLFDEIEPAYAERTII